MLAKGKKKAGLSQNPALNIEQSLVNANSSTNISEFLLNANTALTAENIIISIQGKTILTEKNVAVISGKPKSRKSVIAHSIIASGISKKTILGIEVNTDKNIVLIDTEQSHHDLLKSIHRMRTLAELPNIPDTLKIYSVRQLNVLQIRSLLTIICQDAANGIVIIDGALDLINNMNDVEESKSVIDMIKQILTSFNISLILIIHQSKTTNFTIGHFGSYFDRFAQSVIEVSKQESGSSKISSAMMRSDADFKPYEFYYNYNINNYSIDWTAEENILIKDPADYSKDKHLQQLQKIYNKQLDQTYTSLIEACKIEYSKSEYWCKKLIKYLFDIELLLKIENKIIINDIPF